MVLFGNEFSSHSIQVLLTTILVGPHFPHSKLELSYTYPCISSHLLQELSFIKLYPSLIAKSPHLHLLLSFTFTIALFPHISQLSPVLYRLSVHFLHSLVYIFQYIPSFELSQVIHLLSLFIRYPSSHSHTLFNTTCALFWQATHFEPISVLWSAILPVSSQYSQIHSTPFHTLIPVSPHSLAIHLSPLIS